MVNNAVFHPPVKARNLRSHLGIATAALTLTILPAPGCAAEAVDLEHIRSSIHELKTSLHDDSTQLTSVREQAFELAREILAAEKRQLELDERIVNKASSVKELEEKKREILESLEASRAYLRQNAVSRYAQSLQPKLKILLSQDDARNLNRNLAYYDYVIAGHHRDIRKTRSQVETLARTEAALKLEMNRLRTMRHETIRHLELLRNVRSERAELASIIEARMDLGNTRMDQLREDERHLIELIGELERAQRTANTNVAFIDLKGKLDWPAQGRVANAPGMALREGGARWAGVVVQAQSGTEVTSVAGGRIVFADWFRNLGLLIIIDHGDGYMTLYGNNSELHKKADDLVDAGEIIATVGDGGGEAPDGLYFELRARGEPLDPRPWFIATH
jgi:murein hydrolase activator